MSWVDRLRICDASCSTVARTWPTCDCISRNRSDATPNSRRNSASECLALSNWTVDATVWLISTKFNTMMQSGSRKCVAVKNFCFKMADYRHLGNQQIAVSHIYFASAAVAVDSSHTTASLSASWSRFSPPSNSVNGRVLTMWFMVCRWPQSPEGDWTRPHICKLAWHGPWPVQKRFIRDHVWHMGSRPVTFWWLWPATNHEPHCQHAPINRIWRWTESQWKAGCRMVGSVTIVWLTTEADDQSSLHCVTVSTDVMSDLIGRRDASRGG